MALSTPQSCVAMAVHVLTTMEYTGITVPIAHWSWPHHSTYSHLQMCENGLAQEMQEEGDLVFLSVFPQSN